MCVCMCVSPHSACHNYLGSIFVGVLKNGLLLTTTWSCVVDWLQVAVLSGTDGCRR